jgi:hypothetical protein
MTLFWFILLWVIPPLARAIRPPAEIHAMIAIRSEGFPNDADGHIRRIDNASPLSVSKPDTSSKTDTSPRSANQSGQRSKSLGAGMGLMFLLLSGFLRTTINSHLDGRPRQASPAERRQAAESERQFLESMRNRPTWQRALEMLILFENLIRDDPKNAEAYNGHARLLATYSDNQFRKCAEWELGQGVRRDHSSIETRAVEDATLACKLTDWKNGSYLDTLAAACAAAGDFGAAVNWQSKAIELVAAKEKADFQSRLELYRAHKRYRAEPSK